jgi:cob(I)alamin adenosyltransferase
LPLNTFIHSPHLFEPTHIRFIQAFIAKSQEIFLLKFTAYLSSQFIQKTSEREKERENSITHKKLIYHKLNEDLHSKEREKEFSLKCKKKAAANFHLSRAISILVFHFNQ